MRPKVELHVVLQLYRQFNISHNPQVIILVHMHIIDTILVSMGISYMLSKRIIMR